MKDTCASKIVHSSAMHYQNLIIIHECSKKLLKMKNSNKKLTPSIYIYIYIYSYGFERHHLNRSATETL